MVTSTACNKAGFSHFHYCCENVFAANSRRGLAAKSEYSTHAEGLVLPVLI
jgi:hypothetical protein